jgi:hypothetical protein
MPCAGRNEYEYAYVVLYVDIVGSNYIYYYES